MLRTNTLTTSKAKHFLDTVPFYKVLPPTFKRSPPPPYVVVEMNQFGAVLRRFSQEKRNLPKQPPPPCILHWFSTISHWELLQLLTGEQIQIPLKMFRDFKQSKLLIFVKSNHTHTDL